MRFFHLRHAPYRLMDHARRKMFCSWDRLQKKKAFSISEKAFVPRNGFEPSHLAAPPPEDGASTNFATWAEEYRTEEQGTRNEKVRLHTWFFFCSGGKYRAIRIYKIHFLHP